MKIRRLFTISAAVLTVISLCACGSPAGTFSALSQEDTQSPEDPDRTIHFWCIATEDPDAGIMKYAVDQFNQETDSGYRVEMTAIQNDKYKEKLMIAMSSDECPDMYTSWTGGPLVEYVKAGFAKPITGLYKEAGLDKIYMPAATSQASYNQEIYAVPIINTAICGVFYNKEIFEEYGLKVPQTISEMEKICDKLKKHGIIPFALANSSKWQGSMYYQELATRYAGLEDFKNAYAGSGSFEAECFQYAGRKIEEWAEKGYFPKDVNLLSSDDGQDKQMMYKESAAMLCSGSWYTGTFKQDSEEFYKKIGWFPFPECDEVPQGKQYASICNGTIGDQFISFSCSGDKLKAAFGCARHFSDEKEINAMVEAGKIPPVQGIRGRLTDQLLLEICDYAENAKEVQLWYDQFLPPSVAAVHLRTCQRLFDLSITPGEAAAETQEAMKAYLNSE